uniref:Sulfotransferase domain-containing protein n=1 Tax=Octactis speculum TaxID=3111310 RepID=A0A7S2C259_9STRA
MKSGTTTLGKAMKSLGMLHQSRWTEPFVKANAMDEWFLHPQSWSRFYPQIRAKINGKEGFEDFPWMFLYRRYQAFAGDKTRVGYVLTLRNCRDLAESSAAYNNRNQKGQNSPFWVSSHCDRVHRRCHVHQLDIYNWLVHERKRGVPIDDFLVVEMVSSKSNINWRQFRDFVIGGGRAAYQAHGAPELNANAKKLLQGSAKIKALPHSNSRPDWQKAKGKYCHDRDFTATNLTVDGSLLAGLPPHPMSRGCDKVGARNSAGCKSLLKRIMDYYGGNPPDGSLPPFQRGEWEKKKKKSSDGFF